MTLKSWPAPGTRPPNPANGTFSAAWIDADGAVNYGMPYGERVEAERERDAKRAEGREAWVAEW